MIELSISLSFSTSCSFSKSSIANLTSGELEKLIEDGYFPIVYVDLRPIEAKFGFHSFVVVAVDKAEILVLDPACEERSLPHSTFATAWASQRNLAIVVER
ncbi:MAG: hypothetical protein AB7P14_00540 [Blastocatellales bacterium]